MCGTSYARAARLARPLWRALSNDFRRHHRSPNTVRALTLPPRMTHVKPAVRSGSNRPCWIESFAAGLLAVRSPTMELTWVGLGAGDGALPREP